MNSDRLTRSELRELENPTHENLTPTGCPPLETARLRINALRRTTGELHETIPGIVV